jgi:hypothetical protein
MNTKLKIAGGILAGLVAGATLVGTAFAAPRIMASPAFDTYGMMRSYDTSGTFDVPSIAEMNSFMNRYRTSAGAIDINRMHSDVTSGKVTPPCLDGAARTKSAPGSRAGRTSPLLGSGMMNGVSSDGGSGLGYGMMNSTY